MLYIYTYIYAYWQHIQIQTQIQMDPTYLHVSQPPNFILHRHKIQILPPYLNPPPLQTETIIHIKIPIKTRIKIQVQDKVSRIMRKEERMQHKHNAARYVIDLDT